MVSAELGGRRVARGRAQPLGATPDETGVNFSIYSPRATSVQLLLFDGETEPAVVELDPAVHRSFYFWHCHVGGIGPGQRYAFRVDGPGDAHENGSRHDPQKVLIDPYGKAIDKTRWDRNAAVGPGDNSSTAMRSVVLDTGRYDWEGDAPPRIPLADTVIYEMHVAGFTKSPTSGAAAPGTFRGVIEKIPYLVDLGITAVELLPVFDFDATEVLRTSPDGAELRNYWGYDPIGFFSLHQEYSSAGTPEGCADEFRDMVKALHRNGIEVILDVVFNHTSEGDEHGPAISFRGTANESYYHLSPDDPGYYMDYTGCGNSVNANHPLVTKMICDSLEHWVVDFHVDGFRFDLASELARGVGGAVLEQPPVLWEIELSEVLRDTKIIAEPWDAAGVYQVGNFPGQRWCEWNGLFRDDVRRFVRGDGGMVAAVARRIAGSEEIYGPQGKVATNGINFVTAHDGFTLRDLVSYNQKHNEANGEQNRDGSNENYSWNCGVEGDTDDPGVLALRGRQVRNLAAILLLSRGTPMIQAGDEAGRTQRGNNNGYCLDDERTWFDWSRLAADWDLLRFFRAMIDLRRRVPAMRSPRFFGDRANDRGEPEISWHGTELGCPEWHDPNARAFAVTLAGFGGDPDCHVMFNMFHEQLRFELPRLPGRRWLRVVDTAAPPPSDFLAPGTEIPVAGDELVVADRSIVILLSSPEQSR
ncbi:glycogen debranching protein GlgX [Saccharopolyspora sp. NPDC003752]